MRSVSYEIIVMRKYMLNSDNLQNFVFPHENVLMLPLIPSKLVQCFHGDGFNKCNI